MSVNLTSEGNTELQVEHLFMLNKDIPWWYMQGRNYKMKNVYSKYDTYFAFPQKKGENEGKILCPSSTAKNMLKYHFPLTILAKLGISTFF